MRLYLDDDSASTLLVRLLRQAGHEVEIPHDADVAGEDDAVHLTHAVHASRVFLSMNHDDFRNVHNVVPAMGGHHPGILIVQKDNNPKRDLDERGVVRAIRKLLKAGVAIAPTSSPF